jgi:flavodoxin
MSNFFDLIFFSWTGNTKEVFEIIRDELLREGYMVNFKEIRPVRDYPYVIWLLMSFIPGFKVRIMPVEINSKEIFLGMPKWTFNCPPVTSFLDSAELSGRKVYLVISYGGFDEKRYAEGIKKKIEGKGGEVVGTLMLKRKEIQDKQECRKKVMDWLDEIFGFMD